MSAPDLAAIVKAAVAGSGNGQAEGTTPDTDTPWPGSPHDLFKTAR